VSFHDTRWSHRLRSGGLLFHCLFFSRLMQASRLDPLYPFEWTVFICRIIVATAIAELESGRSASSVSPNPAHSGASRIHSPFSSEYRQNSHICHLRDFGSWRSISDAPTTFLGQVLVHEIYLDRIYTTGANRPTQRPRVQDVWRCHWLSKRRAKTKQITSQTLARLDVSGGGPLLWHASSPTDVQSLFGYIHRHLFIVADSTEVPLAQGAIDCREVLSILLGRQRITKDSIYTELGRDEIQNF